MPWWLDKKGEPQCSAGCKDGYVPCLINHKAQPPNDEDEFGPFFFCPECDWTTTGENNPDGTIPCPECKCYSRNDAFTGDFTESECDYCHKKGATQRTIPTELVNTPDWIGASHIHEPCLTKLVGEMRADLDARPCPTCGTTGVRLYQVPEELQTTKELQKQPYRYACAACQAAYLQQIQAERDRLQAHRDYLAGGGMSGTCGGCGKIKDIEFIPPDSFLCRDCGGHPHIAPNLYPTTDATYVVDDRDVPSEPPRGWYDDPEYAGYLRWWSGERWSGGPTLPEYVTAG